MTAGTQSVESVDGDKTISHFLRKVQFLVKFSYSINLFQSIPNVTKSTIKLCWGKGFVERI